MTTFQAIIYAVIHSLTGFLPLGVKAHDILFPYLMGWQAPSGPILGVFSLGGLFSLLAYFRHDLASIFSSFLQMIIFRKKPMTLDERLPLFLGLSSLPVLASSYYFQTLIHETVWTPYFVSLIFALFGVLLLFFDSINRKIKGMFDWKWSDALIIGLIEGFSVIPGWDPLSSILLACFFLNYRREPAVKYAYFGLLPLYLLDSIRGLKGVSFQELTGSGDVTWLTLGTAFVVSFAVGLLAIGGFLKQIEQKGIRSYVVYRIAFAILVCGVYWFRNRVGHA